MESDLGVGTTKPPPRWPVPQATGSSASFPESPRVTDWLPSLTHANDPAAAADGEQRAPWVLGSAGQLRGPGRAGAA